MGTEKIKNQGNPQGSPQVAVIIVCWNNRDILPECFDSIDAQTYKNHRTIVIDNGSTDGSSEFIRSNYPNVTLLEPGENLGFAVANNRGIQLAFKEPSCKYVLLLNTDARISDDWMEKMVAFAENHPKGASFQSLTVDYYDHDIIDSCGIMVDRAGLATQLGYRLKHIELKTQQVFGVNAAAALYSRAFLEAQPFGADYFDADMFMYLEDVDLAARAVMMGWESYFVHETVAYHMGSASSGKNPGYSLYMTYRNNAPMLIKNFPLRILLKVFPGLVKAELARLRGLRREKKYRLMWQIMKGRAASLKMLPTFYRKRRALKKHWAISEDSLWSIMKHPRFRRFSPKELGSDNEPVTVVVLSRNNGSTVEKSLDSIFSQDYRNLEVLLVDNGSSDKTLSIVKEKYPSVTLVKNKDDFGPANGYNEGIVRANRGFPDYIALAKADSVYPKDWLSSLLKTAREHPKVFAVGSILERNGSRSIGYDFSPRTGARELYAGDATPPSQEVLACHGNGGLFSAEAIESLGFFDGDFYNGLEEIDWCLRARMRGYSCYAQGTSPVTVLGEEPSKEIIRYHWAKNSYFIYVKDLPFKLLVMNSPRIIAMALSSVLKLVASGHIMLAAKLVAKCLYKTPRILKRRAIIQGTRILPSKELAKLFTQGSI